LEDREDEDTLLLEVDMREDIEFFLSDFLAAILA
jgi:hypothetical protein